MTKVNTIVNELIHKLEGKSRYILKPKLYPMHVVIPKAEVDLQMKLNDYFILSHDLKILEVEKPSRIGSKSLTFITSINPKIRYLVHVYQGRIVKVIDLHFGIEVEDDELKKRIERRIRDWYLT